MCTKRPDHQFERQPRLGWRVPAPLLSSKARRERAWDKRKLLGNLVQGIPPWGVDGLGVKGCEWAGTGRRSICSRLAHRAVDPNVGQTDKIRSPL
jgi:hypothetical protein